MATSPLTACAGDSALLPMHVMSVRSRGIFLISHQPLVRCSFHRPGGVHSARALTVLPTSEDVSIPSCHFRILLLRRLQLPLPLGPRACSCRGTLDEYGDHRAACATSGALPEPFPSSAPSHGFAKKPEPALVATLLRRP